MKALRLGKKLAIVAIGLLLGLLILKIVLFLTAKPKIEVDYLAMINALSKPLDYDPNKDGFKYLTEASDLYTTKKAPLSGKTLWPNEMDEMDISVLKTWLAANSDAFDAYKKAGESDYIWRKLKENSESNGNDSPKLWPENEIDVRRCLFWHAKLKAFEGNFEATLENLLTAWRVGTKYAHPNYPLAIQTSALLERQDVLDTAMDIVDVYRPPSADLGKWQRQLQKQFELDSYIPGLEAEKLDCYDRIQRSFVHKSNGTGRVYWRYLREFVPPCEDTGILNMLLILIAGPTESQVYARVDSMITRYKDLVIQPPWEIRYPEQQYVKFQETYNKMPGLFDYFVTPLHSFTIFYHRVKMRQDALITILATLRFNTQYGRYPYNLGELVQEGLLTDLPRDPFSRGPLMYNQLDDDFELYSIGPDFSDDGGRHFQGGNPLTGAPYGDEVFWPPLRKGRKNVKVLDMRTFDDIE